MMLGTVRPVPSAFNGPFDLGKVGCGRVRAAARPGVLVEYDLGGYSPGQAHPKSGYI